MTKNIRNGIILSAIIVSFIAVSFLINIKSLSKDVYSYNKGVIIIGEDEYVKLYNEDFNYVNVDKSTLQSIGYLNKNNYFKENIEIYSLSNGKSIYIDQFQDYINTIDPYIYGGLYINKDYIHEFLDGFEFSKYYEGISDYDFIEIPSEYSSIIKSVVLEGHGEDRLYEGIKQDLSEYSYNLNIPHNSYKNVFLKIKLYRTKNNDLVFKYNNEIYYINEIKNDLSINEKTSYYTYRGDDYGYVYNKILSEDDLYEFAFHDYIIENMNEEKYAPYVNDVFNILNNEVLSVRDKTLLIKEILYTKYKPTLREEFTLRIERIKNLNVINDNRKTYRINHNFLFRILNYPADVYSLAFYEDDLLYNIPERYKPVYENFVNLIINDPNIEYTKKNDMIVELQNSFVVVDEDQLKSMREKYGEIEVLEESNTRIKYAPGYYGFLYDDIKNNENLKEFALHDEVLGNIYNDYFKEIYIYKINEVLSSEDTLVNKITKVIDAQLKFTLIPLDKEKYYRETYKDNYYKESYINKVRSYLM